MILSGSKQKKPRSQSSCHIKLNLRAPGVINFGDDPKSDDQEKGRRTILPTIDLISVEYKKPGRAASVKHLFIKNRSQRSRSVKYVQSNNVSNQKLKVKKVMDKSHENSHKLSEPKQSSSIPH